MPSCTLKHVPTSPVFNGVDDTVELDDGAGTVDTAHRNYDELMEATPQGAHFLANFKHVPGVRRRRQSNLGVSRVPFIEPIGNSREGFFEAKLVLGFPWYCPTLPEVVHREDGSSVLSTPSDVTPRSNWGDNNWTLLF